MTKFLSTSRARGHALWYERQLCSSTLMIVFKLRGELPNVFSEQAPSRFCTVHASRLCPLSTSAKATMP